MTSEYKRNQISEVRVKTVKQSTYGGVIKEERASARREQLLKAATHLIGTKGFKAATVRAVCTESGLAQRYYYETFDNSEDMLIQVYNLHIERIVSLVEKSFATEESLQGKIRAGLISFFQVAQKDPAMIQIVFHEIFGVSKTVDSAYIKGTKLFATIFLQVALPFLGKVNNKNARFELIAQAFVGAIIQVTTSWMLEGFKRDIDEIVDNLSMVIGFTISGLGLEPSTAQQPS